MMSLPFLKLAAVCLASVSLVCAGPAWSAEAAKPTIKKVTKAKVKPKAKAKAKSHVRAKTVAKNKRRQTPPAAQASAVVAPVAPAAAPVAAAAINPYLAGPAAPVANPYLPAAQPAAAPGYAVAAVPARTYQLAAPAATSGNPYLPSWSAPSSQSYTPAAAPAAAAGESPFSSMAGNIRDLLPSLPTEGQSILPHIKKVYPTGEKPLVVVTFKCPTEVVGITPPPTKLLHELVTGGMNLVNASNLLSFNLQQVCQ
ncbi:hypothetical protein EZJ19_04925 [Parasulfuritortus cantonensis]|uniref:Uncharacterized protein n=1 Tax=Parasulfuritortus cantonensis TaxID=2528202 RepID=A0A4R1BGE1_9PROT|nr:hypothetical protein [Parasulfuritortus cantonensis]TCJ16253.1 hypothetical protein EZJ19_04925 [Parasulfuritortus cantonensis]